MEVSPNNRPRILAAYHGLDTLPDRASLICPTMVGGMDGLPVVFSVQIDTNSVSPSAFSVVTTNGERVTPVCATLAPAIEPLERRTVLLAGEFSTNDTSPMSVEVVGALKDIFGNSLEGVLSPSVIPLDAGPTLVLAERFAPNEHGLEGECPEATEQVIQLTWAGGVHGIDHQPLGEPQRLGTTVVLNDNRHVKPIALADDDPDNHVHVCLDTLEPARTVTVAAALFEDPGRDPNPVTSIDIIP